MSRRNNEDHIETKTNPLTEEVNDVKTEDPVLTENADDTATVLLQTLLKERSRQRTVLLQTLLKERSRQQKMLSRTAWTER